MVKILQKSNIIYRKNSVQRNTICGKDYAKIRHHLWKKFCTKQTPSMEKILRK
jgi:hypothetical protein